MKRSKSSAQLEREIDDVAHVPAWAKGLDLSVSRQLSERLHVSQDEIEAKHRRIESDRRAALPSISIASSGGGFIVRPSSSGVAYSKYHAVVQALKVFDIPMGNAIPPNIFVPARGMADKAKAREEIEEALRFAGYRVIMEREQ